MENAESIRHGPKHPAAICIGDSRPDHRKSRRFLLNDGTLVKIGKVLSKLGFTRVRRGNGHAFKVRILESDSVEQGKHNMDDGAEQRDQGMDEDMPHDEDQQMEITRRRSNGNLFTSAGEDFLPF